MTSKLPIDIKSISLQAIEKSLLSPSSLLSQLREFGHEIAAKTGYTEEESKKRVAYTVIRMSSLFEHLYENFELKPESLRMYSYTLLQLTELVENEWGFVPETMKKDVKQSINKLCVLFNTFKPLKSYLSLKNKIRYRFNSEVKNTIDDYQKEIDSIKRNLAKLLIVINKANSKPISEVTRWEAENFDENYSALTDGVIKSYEKMSKEEQKRIFDNIIQNIIDYGKEINPDDETIKEIEEIRQLSQEEQVELSQEIEQDFKKQPIPCESKTFKSLIQQVQPVSLDFDSRKAKEEYFNHKYEL